MADKKQADRIIFLANQHHRQVLRSQIDPSLIDKIEIDKNPSLNYRKAYKNLFNDELQKTVQMIEEKKQKSKQLGEYDKYLFTVGMKEGRSPMKDQSNMSASMLSNYGRNFIDYDQQRTLKYQNLISKNYDGGQAFYKAHDEHLQRKRSQANLTNQTLSSQLQFKEYMKMKEQEKNKQENQAFEQMKRRKFMVEQQRLQKQKYEREMLRQDIAKQIEQQRQRKQKKSRFEYQNLARHNPITNPIQYHIDNPYILKEIQARNLVKSQSLHQFPRG